MSTISYTRVSRATNQYISKFQLPQRWSMVVNKFNSMKKGGIGSKSLLALILLAAMYLAQRIFNTLFAVKTRIVVEPNPLQEGAEMLRFIKKTIKLTAGAFIGLVLMLLLALAAIVVLLIQLIAHSPM